MREKRLDAKEFIQHLASEASREGGRVKYGSELRNGNNNGLKPQIFA